MISDMLHYKEPVFRPPSEWRSLILQITNGCSWNKCAFCEMYKQKPFSIRSISEIEKDLVKIKEYGIVVDRVFLADGNATVLSTAKILEILELIHKIHPGVRRISSYALPRDLISKSDAELTSIRECGLSLLYIGIESGDDQLLRRVNKRETYRSTMDGILKSKNAGIKHSVMLINGLGGKTYSEGHIKHSMDLVNQIQPEYLSTLVLSFPFGIEHFKNSFAGTFEPMDTIQLITELKSMLERSELERTIFRSDHASNYISLKGVLNRDKGSMVKELDQFLNSPDYSKIRSEWERGL